MKKITSLGILISIATAAAPAVADGNGTLGTSFQEVIRGGGLVAVGDGTAGRVTNSPVASTDLTFSIPAGTNLVRSFIYVNTIGTPTPASLSLVVNGDMVDAPLIGADGPTCWGTGNLNRGYRADVSETIAQPGTVTVSGFPSTIDASDDSQGVALLAIYEDPTSGDGTVITITDGMIATSAAANHSNTIGNLNITAATTAARLVSVVGDGQNPGATLTLNSSIVSTDAFPGALGPMFDVRDDDVFALLNVPVTLGAVDISASSDCLAWMVSAMTYTFPDNDIDGIDDATDDDDDNDGVLDTDDTDPLDPAICEDTDNDGCDDCAIGVDGFGPLDDFDPDDDGLDTDADGICDDGDNDDDNDGIDDAMDSEPLDPAICEDADNDTCDDCAVGTDGLGPLPDNDPANDGPDADADGICDDGDMGMGGAGGAGGGMMTGGAGGMMTSGAGGATSGVGGSTSSTGTGGGNDAGDDDDGAIEEVSGCGCRIPAQPANPDPAWLLLAGMGLTALRRRRG